MKTHLPELSRKVPKRYSKFHARLIGTAPKEPGRHILFHDYYPVWSLTLDSMLNGAYDIIKPHIKDADVFDCGSGTGDFLQVEPAPDFFRRHGAKRYVGIDLAYPSYAEHHNGIPIYHIPEDILRFIARIPYHHPTKKLFLFSGVELLFEIDHAAFQAATRSTLESCFTPSLQSPEHVREYLCALHDELGRVTKAHDSIYIGARNDGISTGVLKDIGFEERAPRLFVKR